MANIGAGDVQSEIWLSLLGAAIAAAIKIYAKEIDDDQMYEVTPVVWRGTPAVPLLPLAARGQLLAVTHLLLPASIELRLAGCDLYMKSAELKRVVKEPAGSEESRFKIAKEIITKFRAENPDRRMRFKEVFKPEFSLRLPGAKGSQIYKAWGRAIAEAELDWRKGGRPIEPRA